MKEINSKNTNKIIKSTNSEFIYHLLTDKHQYFHPDLTLLTGKCNTCSQQIAECLSITTNEVSKYKKRGHFIAYLNKFAKVHNHFVGNYNKLEDCSTYLYKIEENNDSKRKLNEFISHNF